MRCDLLGALLLVQEFEKGVENKVDEYQIRPFLIPSPTKDFTGAGSYDMCTGG